MDTIDYKKCDNCKRQIYLDNHCELCDIKICSDCVEHDCPYLIKNGNQYINPCQNRIDYICNVCGNQVNLLNYRDLYSDQLEKLQELKTTINNEISRIVERDYKQRSGNDISFCMGLDSDTDYYTQLVSSKYKKQLISLNYTIFKTVVQYHNKKECLKGITRNTAKQKKTTCGLTNCRVAGIKLNCRYCGREYCTTHLQPEIHNCIGLHNKLVS